jgi:hypothetical protein
VVEFPRLSGGRTLWCGSRVSVDGTGTRTPRNFPDRGEPQRKAPPKRSLNGAPSRVGGSLGRGNRRSEANARAVRSTGLIRAGCLMFARLLRKRGIPPLHPCWDFLLVPLCGSSFSVQNGDRRNVPSFFERIEIGERPSCPQVLPKIIAPLLSIFPMRDDYRMNDPACQTVLLAPREEEKGEEP